MRKILGACLLALPMLSFHSGTASAWYCEAHSPTGSYGWATRYTRNAAARVALYECAIRTPRRYRCYVTSCTP